MGVKNKDTYITSECRILACEGDDEAMNCIINHYMPLIKKLVKNVVNTYFRQKKIETEEDLIQDLIECVIKGVSGFEENYVKGDNGC